MTEPSQNASYDYENYVPEHFESHRGDGVADFRRRNDPYIKRFRLNGVQRVLDVGGGSGELSALLALQGHSVTYLDVSEKAAEFAKNICRAALPDEAFKRIRFLVGNLTQVNGNALDEQMDGQFDLIVSINVWEHLSPEQCLTMVRNAIRFLRPDGRLHIETSPNRIITDMLRCIARLLFGVSGGYRDQQIHINEQTYWSFKKALLSIPERRFRISPVRHPRWIYSEARCAASLGRRPLLKACLPLIWCASVMVDALTLLPGLNRLLCHALCAVSEPQNRQKFKGQV